MKGPGGPGVQNENDVHIFNAPSKGLYSHGSVSSVKENYSGC